MQTQRQITGRTGEEAACRLLEGLGHTILARNWRNAHRELDIITRSGDGIHFIEVKTRTAPAMEDPVCNVNRAKRNRMVRAAGAYMRERQFGETDGNTEIFFDIVSVLLDGDKPILKYYPQAFIPLYV